ncbi:SCF ubiquitin ligase complex subunit [Vanrija albida]|uniref:SCF ubiquitin ligase complex subunit n=1 Tax=Vanrija albida TaxID=181172 RepID=A0ABR3Q3G9_9TREE
MLGTQDVSIWPRRQRVSPSPPRQVGSASLLPTELLIHIMRYLPANGDLLSAMQVSRTWCLAGYPLLWQKPALSTVEGFASFVRVLASPKTLLPYADIIKRLSVAGFAREINDDLFRGIAACKRLERLTLSGAVHLSPKALNDVFRELNDLIAIDVSGVTDVDDTVAQEIAISCPKTQGLNLTDCKQLTDEGLLAIAASMKNLRRIKLSSCQRLTDRSIVALVRACPLLLELDLADVPQLSNDSTVAMFFNTQHLRELRMNDNKVINDRAIPDLEKIPEMTDQALFCALGAYPWYLRQGAGAPKALAATATSLPNLDPVLLKPVTLHFEQLRQVDFTSCTLLRDQAVENLVNNASKLRSITLAKCGKLTDASVYSIARLGKHLHYLHLGHVSLITDASVVKLAHTCTRLRYIDLADCHQLTDQSVIALAKQLPKLRRIGLVKVVNVTDEGIHALSERYSTLERVHLSFCENVSVSAVTFLLNRLLRLTHLSLTGVPVFRTQELQQFCRPAPTVRTTPSGLS